MAQPFKRNARVPSARPVDKRLGEFWVESPWEVESTHNLSCYERNRLFLNVGGKDFRDVSSISGADSDGDGRAAFAADLDGDGRQDLVVRQAGGGALLLLENRVPTRNHWLKVSLRGKQSNTRGIGARLTAQVGKRRLVRALFPSNGPAGLGIAAVHFGLASAETVDRLQIRWPTGKVQTLSNVPADRHIIVTEFQQSYRTVLPRQK